jgi:hypothetical protein
MGMNGRTYKGTTFGGPVDIWDVAYTPAFFPPVRPGETPAKYYERIPQRFRDFLRPEMEKSTVWPIVEAYIYPAGSPEKRVKKSVNARISYWLNTKNKLYCAYNVTSKITREKALAGKAFLEVTANGKTLLLPIIDNGYSGDNYKIIDMSPAAYELLELDKINKIASVKLVLT